jgi:hypothetical protein
MGEANRRQVARYGERAALIDGEMTIVRFAQSPLHRLRRDHAGARVEFYLDGFAGREAYDAVCAVKLAFEQAFARAEGRGGGQNDAAP